jgi:hypothetical protein
MRTLILAAASVAALTAPARADDPKAVIEKAIKAHGGADKLDKYKGYKATVKGTIVAGGMEIEVKGDTVVAYPDKVKVKGTLSVGGMDLSILQIVTPTKAKFTINGMNMDLPDEELAEQRFSAYVVGLTQLTPLLKGDTFTLKAAADGDVDGKPAVGVVVSSKDRKDVTLYFDKASGLLVKTSRQGRDEGKEVLEEQILGDYKAVDGVQMPHKETVLKAGTRNQEFTTEKYEMLEKVDESEFADD